MFLVVLSPMGHILTFDTYLFISSRRRRYVFGGNAAVFKPHSANILFKYKSHCTTRRGLRSEGVPGGVDWWVSSSWLQNYASLEPQKPANLRWRQGLHPEHVARPTQHWGTNKHRSHLQKTLCCQSASMSMSQGSWSFTRGLTQTQGIGNIDHIDKASFLPLDNMNNSSANHQWSVHVSLL